MLSRLIYIIDADLNAVSDCKQSLELHITNCKQCLFVVHQFKQLSGLSRDYIGSEHETLNCGQSTVSLHCST